MSFLRGDRKWSYPPEGCSQSDGAAPVFDVMARSLPAIQNSRKLSRQILRENPPLSAQYIVLSLVG